MTVAIGDGIERPKPMHAILHDTTAARHEPMHAVLHDATTFHHGQLSLTNIDDAAAIVGLAASAVLD